MAELPKGTESISISVPSYLIELMDGYAAKNDLTRSGFIVRSVRKYLLMVAFDDPHVWEALYQGQVGKSR